MPAPAFEEALRFSGRPERIAALTAWFQGLFAEDPPTLVGGGAVELYTAGSYVTGDLDFVGTLPSYVRERLREAGFRNVGRHWVHEAERLFLELPGSSLAPGEREVVLEMRGWRIRVVSPEDALVDRLAAWKHWRSSIDGVSAFLIWVQQGATLDLEHLGERARSEHVADALEEVIGFHRDLADRRPTEEELRVWAERQR